MLDEVQNVAQFESLVDALYADKQYDCYITGSNAYLLSSELATFLSGRFVEIHVTPLSFAEYSDGQKSSPRDVWRDYVRYGSMPKVRELVESGRGDDVAQYLDGLYSSVLVNDVITRTKMSDVGTVKKIAYYQVADSVKEPETLARELRPLREVDDNYPKYLIVGDYGNDVVHNGIRQICVQDFLLGMDK